MRVGRKAEAKAKRLVEYLLERIAGNEERFSAWENALSILEGLRFNRKVRTFALTRSIPLGEKTELFQGVFRDAGLSLPEDVAQGVLSVLILENLWDVLPSCRTQLQKRFFFETGQVEVSIESAHPIDAGEKKKIEQLLSEKLGNLQVRANWTMKPELIAGLVIQAGTHVWDGSLKGRLNQMQNELLDRA
ncbi:MAG: F0F1 ATP synthase subunit delta [Nitrospirae bacterium]|jgi:F-type H+-transporting ATPase subunit delta|nr:F0F1 ATP synthase subunit delta [Nitrospirota bacterium]